VQDSFDQSPNASIPAGPLPPSQRGEKQPDVPDSRLGAAIYEPFLWLGERRGMAERRRRLLSGASGRVLEIGAGTGLNLPHYPSGLEELVLAEPAGRMAAHIDADRFAGDAPISVVEAPAEVLPFADESFDTVVATMVLCTVADPDRALSEVSRVLRPGGRLLFCEHVEASSRPLRAWQRRLASPWAAFADGCRCDRPTLETIGKHLKVTSFDSERWQGMPALVRPLVVGEAARR
jgi:SAM-dependent methyltransferase